jgi:hypothetical protein
MMLGSLSVLPSGCMKTSAECDWARQIPFGSQQTISWLMENDRALLSNVVAHNETATQLCDGR